jgi:hypothetical protein
MSNHPIEIDDAVMYAVPSKAKMDEIVTRLVVGVQDGSIDPLQLLVKLKFAQSIIADTIESIQPNCVDEASKYHKGEDIKLLGAELKVKEAGTKYDYSNCGDKIWEQYDFMEKSNAEAKKGRANFLKSLKKSETLVDDETGEIYTIHPPIKKSSTIVQVTIK